MAKVYLESSFFSACVSTRTDPKTTGWRVTSNEWWDNQSQHHELFISAEVVRELAAPTFPNSADALKMARAAAVLDDVRRIRAEFEKDSGGDLRRHVEQSNRALQEYREKLGLKIVQPPRRRKRPDRM